MGRRNWSLLSHLKRSLKKVSFLLHHFYIHRCRLASITNARKSRSVSFNDRLGLCEFTKDENQNESSSTWCLQRTRSYAAAVAADEEDIDKRAEMFIVNFRRQLRLERQISLELSYCRGNSFGT
ncbi:uncharacterized protein LOC132310010 [Cornus florida]|uniref:uncharacterized protein LOC132310010 n=1 Tax=Cornus florida TaxID=4283 RepID=UPI00289B01BF|nr:uncharacterized protein LOC132310010 [Cornus florida]